MAKGRASLGRQVEGAVGLLIALALLSRCRSGEGLPSDVTPVDAASAEELARDAPATFDAADAIETDTNIEGSDAGTLSDTIPDTQMPPGTPCRRASAVFEPGPYPRESLWLAGAYQAFTGRSVPGGRLHHLHPVCDACNACIGSS